MGHSLQKDTVDSSCGFERYIESCIKTNDDNFAVCKLTKNYRGKISQWADNVY